MKLNILKKNCNIKSQGYKPCGAGVYRLFRTPKEYPIDKPKSKPEAHLYIFAQESPSSGTIFFHLYSPPIGAHNAAQL